MRAWHWCQTQQELTWPVVLGSGWAEFFIEWLRFWVELYFTNNFDDYCTFVVRIHQIKEIHLGCWGVAPWHMIVVKFCWGIDTNVPGSSRVSVRFRSQVKRQPKHDSSDSLTCWLQSLKSNVCPAGILSPVSWGLSLATLTLLISALHQCPVCLYAIGQSSPHGTLISLTSSIDPHCEMVRGFDLSEPTQILTYKQAQHKH